MPTDPNIEYVPNAFGLSRQTAPPSRQRIFKGDTPLTAHTLECLQFLDRVVRVQVEGEKNKEFAIHVQDSKDEGDETGVYTIKRHWRDIKQAPERITRWSSMHPVLHESYGVHPCSYCGAFTPTNKVDKLKHGASGLVHAVSRVVTSSARLARDVEEELSNWVALARARRSGEDEKLMCEGVEHIPAILVELLLKGVDSASL